MKTRARVPVVLALAILVQSDPAAALDTANESPSQQETSVELSSFSGDAPWQDFHSDAEGFSVALPGSPELISNTTKTFLGPVKETAYRVRNRLGEFAVELHELPSLSALFAPARLVIGKARDNLLESRSAEQLSFNMVQGGDYPQGILTFRSADTKFELEEIHLVLAGKRLYVLAAGLLKGSERPSMERFFNSFRVSERSK